MDHQLQLKDFQQEATLPAVKLKNNDIQEFVKNHKDLINHSHNILKVHPFDQTHKLVPVISTLTQQKLKQFNPEAELINHKFLLTYQNFSAAEMFNHYVPKVDWPNSFETIGHIAHYNLTEEQVPHGKLIGQILLQKLKTIKTVVNKTQKLHNVYRTPILQLLAGQKNYQVEVRELGTRFKLDFEKVYWCSRLSTQRDRVLKLFKKGQTLLDLFCGVGPLAVRAARNGLNVIANDLNPDCYKYLTENAELNKVSNRMLCFNDCAREVAKKWYDELYVDSLDNKFKKFHHVYMNLPVDAVQFLDVFQDFLLKSKWKAQQLPMMHVNGFVVGIEDDECKGKMAERIAKVLPNFRKQDIEVFGYIKNVTNVMRMYCVSFRLPGGLESKPLAGELDDKMQRQQVVEPPKRKLIKQ